MSLAEACRYVHERYEYQKDRFGRWRVMSGDKLEGDCEDVVLTVMHRHFGGWRKMLRALWSGRAKVWTCLAKTSSGGTGHHAVGQIGELWFDNWTHRPLHRDQFLAETGHKLNKAYHPLYVFMRLTGWLPHVVVLALAAALYFTL